MSEKDIVISRVIIRRLVSCIMFILMGWTAHVLWDAKDIIELLKNDKPEITIAGEKYFLCSDECKGNNEIK
jgi:hypothetical protein